MGKGSSFDDIRSSRGFVILTVAVAIFVDNFLYGLVIPILPTLLRERARVEPNNVQVSISGLLATFNATLVIGAPVSGYLADRWSNRKVPFLGGLVACAATTALFMVSEDLTLLYLARALQGLSAAIVWAVGLALLIDTVGPKDVGIAMGWVTFGLSLGMTFGPFLGGILYQKAGHYLTFGMAIAVITVDVVLRLLLKEPKPHSTVSERHGSAEDREQQPLLSQAGINHDAAGAFNIIKLLTYSDMVLHLWSVFLISVILYGLETVIPLHVQNTFHYGSLGAGLIFFAIVISIFLSPVIGMLYDKLGNRPLVIAGLLLAAVFSPLLAFIRSYSTTNVVIMFILLFFVGLGISLVMTPEMAEIAIFADKQAEKEPDAFGPRGATAQCTALMTVATALAGVVGPIATGMIQTTHGWIATTVTVGAIAALGLISLMIKNAYSKKRPE